MTAPSEDPSLRVKLTFILGSTGIAGIVSALIYWRVMAS